jgi:hypothetical protein
VNRYRHMGRIFSTTGQTPVGQSGLNRERAFPGKALLLSFLLVSISFLSCSSETTLKGTPVPTPGMKLEEKDRIWRGGVIGAALGSPVEGKITDILIRAAREGAKDNVPLVYVSLDGVQRVEIHPSKGGPKDNCRLIRVQVYQEGALYRDTLEEICW